MNPQVEIKVGGPLEPGSLYVERPEDRAFVRLIKQGRWLDVFGCRTMGKTSLVNRWRPLLDNAGFAIAYVDVGGHIGLKTAPSTWTKWVSRLATQCSLELNLEEDLIQKALRELHSPGPAQLLERLFDAIGRQIPERQILLVLDESNVLGGIRYGTDLIFALRTLNQARAKRPALRRVSICVLGLRPIHELGSAIGSPFLYPLPVGDFRNNKSVCDRIAGNLNSVVSKVAIRRILDQTGGQPYLTMFVLEKAMAERCRSIADVDRLCGDIVRQGKKSGNSFGLFSSMRDAILEQKDHAIKALHCYSGLLQDQPVAQSQHNPGAKLLETVGLVRRRWARIEIKSPMFRDHFDTAEIDEMLNEVAAGRVQYRGAIVPRKGRVCIINTGGTIGMVPRGDKIVPAETDAELRAYFPELSGIAKVDFVPMYALDSINVYPPVWKALADYIYQRQDDYSGFVIAHGTDTMPFTASAVAFALGEHLRFPVVFTGAQTTPDVLHGDARTNLYRACLVAQTNIPEVVICFGEYVFRACRAQKKDDRRFDGFESPTYPPLAVITGEVNIQNKLLRKLPRPLQEINLRTEFEQGLLPVVQYPGLEPEFFSKNLTKRRGKNNAVRGIIVQTLGAGNVANIPPFSFMEFINKAYLDGIPVIITSQYPPDPGSHTRYAPAIAPIEAGAIHAGNMTVAAAVTKFRWVLAQVYARPEWPSLSPAEKRSRVEQLMVKTDFVGELADHK